jgi:DNA-binding CsgD family transcriptional regulator
MNTAIPTSTLIAPRPDERSGEIQDLLKNLVCKLSSSVGGSQENDQPDNREKVILDLNVGGIRCVFIEQIDEPVRASVGISPRERTIARLVAAGHPNKTIAHVLRISTWTVSTHLRRIFAKLGVSSRAAMVAHLMETGVLNDR